MSTVRRGSVGQKDIKGPQKKSPYHMGVGRSYVSQIGEFTNYSKMTKSVESIEQHPYLHKIHLKSVIKTGSAHLFHAD